eukprot:scaffold6743_cov158-Ochromonas_danica.AAC.8
MKCLEEELQVFVVAVVVRDEQERLDWMTPHSTQHTLTAHCEHSPHSSSTSTTRRVQRNYCEGSWKCFTAPK